MPWVYDAPQTSRLGRETPLAIFLLFDVWISTPSATGFGPFSSLRIIPTLSRRRKDLEGQRPSFKNTDKPIIHIAYANKIYSY